MCMCYENDRIYNNELKTIAFIRRQKEVNAEDTYKVGRLQELVSLRMSN